MSRVDALIAQARADTGLQDMGAPSWIEGFERLVHSLDREARLSLRGATMFDRFLTGRLINRLRIEDCYARHPEIEDQEIVAPLFGLGLPRTGSTALGCLLAEDPATRSIRMWESISPAPPETLASGETDPRIAAAEQILETRNRNEPRKKQMVPMAIDAPMECTTFVALEFVSQMYPSMVRVPAYVEWVLTEADATPGYAYLKRCLKLLQWQSGPRRWQLRNPSHSQFITALDTIFPDARFWMTHRDITKVIPSCADLFYEQYQVYSDQVDKAGIGALSMRIWSRAMERMIAFRDAGNEDRFFDIHFAPFQADPFPSLQRLYDWQGWALTDQAKAKMGRWRAETPKDKHGAHTYDAADFGIDLVNLARRFDFYTERFMAAGLAA